MAGKRTTFRAEFKKQLVELYLQEQHEKTLAQVARENGVGGGDVAGVGEEASCGES